MMSERLLKFNRKGPKTIYCVKESLQSSLEYVYVNRK